MRNQNYDPRNSGDLDSLLPEDYEREYLRERSLVSVEEEYFDPREMEEIRRAIEEEDKEERDNKNGECRDKSNNS